MTVFDLSGALRRIRRQADLSQRELAQACGVSQSVVARAESGHRDFPAGALARAAELSGLHLVLVDADGAEVAPMRGDAVRDMGNRRFPAHLDTRYSEEDWWHGPHRFAREQPWYTFDRDRRMRDRYTRRNGTPADHLSPRPGDSPQDRAAARRCAYLRSRAEERERRFLAGEFRDLTEPFECMCPPACDDTDPVTGDLIHAPGCPCFCDVD
jgi:transcriptional regulator with XRE-family HTH domain